MEHYYLNPAPVLYKRSGAARARKSGRGPGAGHLREEAQLPTLGKKYEMKSLTLSRLAYWR
jgi:hypothetical protein